MNEKDLQNTGLGLNEGKAYLALLRLGTTTTTAILRETAMPTSKVYESLTRLQRKGLAAYSTIRGVKHWRAENPVRILDLLDQENRQLALRRTVVEHLVTQLQSIQPHTSNSERFTVYEGIAGIKTAREQALLRLKRGEEMLIILSTMPAITHMEGFWSDFQRRRARKGIRARYLVHPEFSAITKTRIKLPLTAVRTLPTSALSPTWTEIYPDLVGIGVLGPNPSLLIIADNDVVAGHQQYFEQLWGSAKAKRRKRT